MNKGSLGLRSIEKVLISVNNKTGISDFAYELARMDVQIASTGGTATEIRKKVLRVEEISDLTGFPECMDGRLKTLHPVIMGGILADRDKPEHTALVRDHQMFDPDLVVVNLYNFEKTIAKAETTLAEAVEKIDIGGNTMIRAAVKNFESVAVVIDPDDYRVIINEMIARRGCLSRETRFSLAQKAFDYVFGVETAINKYLMLAKLR